MARNDGTVAKSAAIRLIPMSRRWPISATKASRAKREAVSTMMVVTPLAAMRAARRLSEARPCVKRVCAADSCVVELLDDLEARALGEALDGALPARKRVLVRPDVRRRLRAYYEGDCPIAQRLGQRLSRDGLQPLRLCMIPNVRSASQPAYGGEARKLPLRVVRGYRRTARRTAQKGGFLPSEWAHGNGRTRREADVADHGRGRRNWVQPV